MDDNLKANLKSQNTWLRFLFMLFFGFCSSIALWLIWIVAGIQFLFSLITGGLNDNLTDFSKGLRIYLRDVVDYLLYETDDKPFPFSPLPGSDAEPEQEGSATSVAARKDPQEPEQ